MNIEEYIRKSFEQSYQEAKEEFDDYEFTLKELFDFAAEKSIAISKFAISLVYKSTAEAIRESYTDETALEIAEELLLASEEFEEKPMEEEPIDPLDEKYRVLEEERMRELHKEVNVEDFIGKPVDLENLLNDEEEDECLPF